MFRNVKPLLQPRSIAIVGATDSGGDGWSEILFRNLEKTGFPVPTYLVNPRRRNLWGRKVYPAIGALPEQIDLALILVPAHAVNEVIRDGIAHGLSSATIFSSGFGEGQQQAGAARAQELRMLIRNSGIAVCGPNCMGHFSLPRDILLYPSARLNELPKGPVGGIFHSGGTLGYWFARAAQRGLGFSYAVSCGNEPGLDSADYLRFLTDDPDTEIIVGMIESVRRPEALMEAARGALEAGKPFILTKLGRSEQAKEQARTHTGAVAVDDDVFTAMCRKYGITLCRTLDEMVEFTLAFGQKRLPRSNRLALVASSGGAAGLAIDCVEEEGGVFAQLAPETVERIDAVVPTGVDILNPMDAGAVLARQLPRFCRLCTLFADDDHVDILAIQGRIPLPGDQITTPEDYTALRNATDKPVLAFTRMAQNADEQLRGFQAGAGVPFLFGIPAAIRAAQALIHYAEVRRRGIPPLSKPGTATPSSDADAILTGLAALGLPPPVQQRTPADPKCASRAAIQIGFPVAVKIVSQDIHHKTEAGGVRLGLTDVASVAHAAKDLLDSIGTVDGFLIQEMTEGLEMFAGVRDHPQFGPLVVVGLGGVFVELFRDVSLRLAPVGPEDVQQMLGELRSAAAFDGFRGQPPRDRDAAIGAVVGLSEYFLRNRDWLAEIEVNPLTVLETGSGVRAVDVRLVRRG